VELEEVPESIADLIQEESYRLDQFEQLINDIDDSLRQQKPHISHALDIMDTFRQSLGAFDARLAECEGILQGYATAINPAPQQPEPSGARDMSAKDPKVHEYEKPYGIPQDTEQ
tara:strand:+ start:122 stop:466 length:345 start_codon:yes stop_codon:yes gene_type:complete